MRADGAATDAFLDARCGGRAGFRDVDALVAHELRECSAEMVPVLEHIARFLASHDIATAEKALTLFHQPGSPPTPGIT